MKDEAHLLVEHGNPLPEQLRGASISERNPLEDLREHANLASPDQAEAVCLERNGHLPVVKKKPSSSETCYLP